MNLEEQKIKIDNNLAKVLHISVQITKLSEFIDTLDDPDSEVLIANEILKLGSEFADISKALKSELKDYLDEQTSQGLAINFQYKKLYGQLK